MSKRKSGCVWRQHPDAPQPLGEVVCVCGGRVCVRGAQGLVVWLLLVVAASCQGSSGRERRPGERRASGRRGLEPALTPNEW